jgi:cell division initiation protein
MRLTPIDIQNQKFTRGFMGGYNEEEVDEFLERVLRDYESLYQENSALKEKNELLSAEINRYHQIEESIQKALVTSQNTAEDFLRTKKEEAELILEKAKVEADKIMESTRIKAEAIQKDYAELRQIKEHFLLEFKSLLRAYLSRIEDEKEFKSSNLPPYLPLDTGQ